MKKRILAMLLCVAMLLLPIFIPMAYAQEGKSVYHANIGRKAYFNEMYANGGTIPISEDPATEASWGAAPHINGSEIPLDVIFVIEDVYVDEVQHVYWYQVSMADGSDLPDIMGECTWVMQNIIDDSPEYDSLILMEAEPEETEPQQTEPTETNPGMSDPGMSGPGASDPEETIPEETVPDETVPEETEPEYTQTLWLTYEDYAQAQNQRVMEDPEIYVGFSATFDVNTWANFQYAAAPDQQIPQDDENILNAEDLLNEQGESIRVVITGYVLDEEGRLWYQIEAEEGSVLPEVLEANPYILHVENVEDPASLVIQPLLATFTGDTVTILKEAKPASRFEILETEDLPPFFTVIPLGNGMLDLGDITDWSDVLTEEYHYAWAEAGEIALIAPEVTNAFVDLLSTYDLEGYDALWVSLPTYVKAGFTDQHLQWLHEYRQDLIIVTYNKEVQVNGTNINVSVTGNILEDVTLDVTPIAGTDVLAEGFDVKSADEVIVALDIKLLREDGTEWQPDAEEQIEVSIDMAALGYEDGRLVRLHHKHGDDIEVFEIFVVMDGKVTVSTNGFSVYVVSNTNSTDTSGESVAFVDNDRNGISDNPIVMEVGQTKIFYIDPTNDNLNNNRRGTWVVTDTSGAIYYTVHTNSNIGRNGVYAPWIRITALKESTNVQLQFKYSNITYNNNAGTAQASNAGNERYNMQITPPKGEKQLYLKDLVNTTGSIFATLVDENGQEITNGLAGAAFTWSRSDHAFIVPSAYGPGSASINIAKDHAGLVEARKKANGEYDPVTYTVKAILSDGTELEADYTVYYQSEFVNTNFENPRAYNAESNYVFFVNGWPELYWKATAPGQNEYLTKDIEYGVVNNRSETDFGVPRAADYDEGGTQFAELNAEEVGALYQDIITAPGEKIEWEFSHAPRRSQASWASNSDNKMFIIIGATEDAQKLTTQADLNKITQAAKSAGIIESASQSVVVTVKDSDNKDVTYHVWYHDAKVVPENTNTEAYYNAGNNYGWTELSGTYDVPDGQYRTRLFFVSDDASSKLNFGNLIDTAAAGQYKRYLIEYYEEIFTESDGTTQMTVKHIADKDESGRALIYSFVDLQNLAGFLTADFYVHEVEINMMNYPYSVRYTDANGNEKASLYIESYAKEMLFEDPKYDVPGDDTNDYKAKGYDIVMRVYLRDTIVAVQKQVEFPALMTVEQKLNLMQAGYDVNFSLYQLTNQASDNSVGAGVGTATITSRDPYGGYSGYISLGDDPELNYHYYVQETAVDTLVGLELYEVRITTELFLKGQKVPYSDEFTYRVYTKDQIDQNIALRTPTFILNNETHKIAEITVTNVYVEKQTVVKYQAVGNGKVANYVEPGQTPDFQDAPQETLAFYSGKARGASIHYDPQKATFVGWFKDEACTIPVEEPKDGVIGEDNSFKPNANIIDAEEVTFYAKFETGSIVIQRKNAEPGQVFVYHVVREADAYAGELDFYVTLTCDENGAGAREVLEVGAGTYKVTEVSDWSWRYSDTPQSKAYDGNPKKPAVYEFTEKAKKFRWLNAFSEVLSNIFKRENTGGTT